MMNLGGPLGAARLNAFGGKDQPGFTQPVFVEKFGAELAVGLKFLGLLQ